MASRTFSSLTPSRPRGKIASNGITGTLREGIVNLADADFRLLSSTGAPITVFPKFPRCE